MKTGDVLEDMLGSGVSLKDVLALAIVQDDAREDIANEFDGPPTERDMFTPAFDTWAPSTCPTLPAIYSRDAA